MTEHVHRLRVRYAETDAQQVAHHSAYVVWLEEARIEALRGLGRSYRSLEADGVLMPVVELGITYRRPLSFDDHIEIVTRISAVGRTRLRFDSTVRCEDEVRAEAQVTVAVVDGGGRLRRLPEDLAALLVAG